MQNNNKIFIILKDLKKLSKKKYLKFFKGKIITITGASGLIGQYFFFLFYILLDTKNSPKKIYITSKNPLPLYFNLFKKNSKIVFLKLNLTTKELYRIKKSHIIIHAAGYGQPGKFLNYPFETFKLNTQVTEHLLGLVKKNGSFLFISSSELYSGLNKDYFENQELITNLENNRSIYIEAKKIGENIVKKFKKKINSKSIRLCLCYGPGTKKNDERILNKLIQRGLLDNKILLMDKGKDIRSYIYITDAIEMMLNILIKGRSNMYNVGGKARTTIFNLAELISRKTKKKIFINEKKSLIKNNAPKKAYVDIKKYESEFGKKKFINLNDGLLRTILWQKKLYLKKK